MAVLGSNPCHRPHTYAYLDCFLSRHESFYPVSRGKRHVYHSLLFPTYRALQGVPHATGSMDLSLLEAFVYTLIYLWPCPCTNFLPTNRRQHSVKEGQIQRGWQNEGVATLT